MQHSNTTPAPKTSSKKSLIIMLIFFIILPACTHRHAAYGRGTYLVAELNNSDTIFPARAETLDLHYTGLVADTQLTLVDSIAIYIDRAANDNCCICPGTNPGLENEHAPSGNIHPDGDTHTHTAEEEVHQIRLPRLLRYCMFFCVFLIFI